LTSERVIERAARIFRFQERESDSRFAGSIWRTHRVPLNTSPIPQDAVFVGVDFAVGTFLADLPPSRLVDKALTLPRASATSFWLNGSTWEFPDFNNVDVFVD
jgi:hypothetical protein